MFHFGAQAPVSFSLTSAVPEKALDSAVPYLRRDLFFVSNSKGAGFVLAVGNYLVVRKK